MIRRYLYGEETDAILAYWTPGEGVSWTLTDLVGSVNFELTSDGRVRSSHRFDSFGNLLSLSEPSELGFTGRPNILTSVVDLRNRLFDSGTGRFLSEDPIGFLAQDWNLYRYGANSPLSGSDPFGTEFNLPSLSGTVSLIGSVGRIAIQGGVLFLKFAGKAALAGAVGTLAVELTDILLSQFTCGNIRNDRLEKLAKKVGEGALDNVRTSTNAGIIGLVTAPVAAIYSFFTGPVYSALKNTGNRGLACLKATQRTIEKLFNDLSAAGLIRDTDLQPSF